MVLEQLSQMIGLTSNFINQNIIFIIIALIVISLIFSKRRRTLVTTFIILLAFYLSAFFLNLNGLNIIEIAVPFSITMLFFASEALYFFLIVSILLMLSAPSILIVGGGVSIGVITPFFGETIINKIEELGLILNE
jgi:hypothetical protein